MSLELFHPLIQRWFAGRFRGPTEPQQQGWPQIMAGRHTLIAAPTGSGKTLTAFLAAINQLFNDSLHGDLRDEIRVVYVSPLRALSNDMHRNLDVPLQEIAALAEADGLAIPPLRVGLRTGDTTPAQRAALLKRPPHILVTTPESLYLLLTSVKGRERLQHVRAVIVDEIHALVRDKRGSHLALTLERLAALCPHPIQRIGLSATQRPITDMARFLVGEPPADNERTTASHTHTTGSEIAPAQPEAPSQSGDASSDLPECAIVDVGHQRDLDLAIEVPPSELGAVCMHEQWAEVNKRLVELVQSHRSTLIFVNTRRMAERVTHQLSELLGEDAISSHHGSLAADRRLDTEQRLKTGQLKAVVATASLELGLDVGYIDLVIQLGSPRSIATFLQRVGRSGHALGLVPKGRLFALTRDELLECMALMRAIRAGRLDRIPIPVAPLDILAQQIVAEVACQEWGTDELFALFQRAWPYRHLARSDFDSVVQILAEGMSESSGRGRVYLHHDQVGRRLRSRAGARISATSSGGAIPEIASYRVIAEPEHTVVGTLDEDFASESQAGEIFLLGNTSWRIQYVRGGDVTVTDAAGAPPSIPFWRGEAPGRTIELSDEVSRLRIELEQRLDDPAAAEEWLVAETHITPFAAQQVVQYVAAQKGAIGLVPSQKRVVFERFFDESGGMQMVIHAPFGSRITHAWGLAMRKRFCRSFDFELQASADDDGIVLSLGPQHSFPLESMFPMLNARNVQALLEQALLAVPTFQTRWRWNVTRALLVLRSKNGKKVPPPLQRFRADDLLTSVFPKLTGCQENVVGDIELPDHPLVRQSMHDSLTEAHDIDGLLDVLGRIERGEIELIARDTREPSPFCYELLNANPYAFLDGGEVAERRARAVATRRSLTVESVQDLGRLDPEAIARVRSEAQPLVRTADELHDLLLSRLALPATEGLGWESLFAKLVDQRRAATIVRPDGADVWVAAERLPALRAVFPDSQPHPALHVPPEVRHDWTAEDARVAMVRGLLEICGPTTASEVAARIGSTPSAAGAALEALEGEGVVLRGRFTPDDHPSWHTPSSAARTAAPPLDSATDTDTDTDAETEADTDTEAEADASATSDTADATNDIASPSASPEIEWCHRRLLSRIHRLTMEGLRRQIEPVSVDVFVRFLTRHQGLVPGTQRSGTNGLFEVIGMLQGLDLPAVAWERDLLPARLERFRPEWLDELCLSGEVGWGRLFPPKRLPDRARPMASVTRVVPISVWLRSDARWLQAQTVPGDPLTLSSPARGAYDLLCTQGAMFAGDILAQTRVLPTELQGILGELVSHGLLTADGFGGLRALITARDEDRERRERRDRGRLARRKAPLSGAGRWSLWRRPTTDKNIAENSAASPSTKSAERDARAEIVQEWAWLLLRRWGVVFRDLLEREPGAPPWYELLQVLRRLEARGEIRGGRFIAGVAGEQFALGDTVKQLRQIRDNGPQQELIVLSAADPLNLVGILTHHERVPSKASNRLAYLDGIPIAASVGGELRWWIEPTLDLRRAVDTRLTRTTLADPDAATTATAAMTPPAPTIAATLPATTPPAIARPAPEVDPRTGNPTKPPPKPRQKSLFPNKIPRPR